MAEGYICRDCRRFTDKTNSRYECGWHKLGSMTNGVRASKSVDVAFISVPFAPISNSENSGILEIVSLS